MFRVNKCFYAKCLYMYTYKVLYICIHMYTKSILNTNLKEKKSRKKKKRNHDINREDIILCFI